MPGKNKSSIKNLALHEQSLNVPKCIKTKYFTIFKYVCVHPNIWKKHMENLKEKGERNFESIIICQKAGKVRRESKEKYVNTTITIKEIRKNERSQKTSTMKLDCRE